MQTRQEVSWTQLEQAAGCLAAHLTSKANASRMDTDFGKLTGASVQWLGKQLPATSLPQPTSHLRREIKPALKSVTPALLRELRAVLAHSPKDPDLQAWAETILRVCEIRRQSLRSRLTEGCTTGFETLEKTELLLCFLVEYSLHNQDLRYLNVALKIVDGQGPSLDRALSLATGTNSAAAPCRLSLQRYLLVEYAVRQAGDWSPAPKLIPRPEMTPAIDNRDDASIDIHLSGNSGVVLFSPSRYSLYSLAVAELLRRNGIEVRAIIVRRLTDITRFISEYRRDGSRLLKKIWRKLVLRRKGYEQLPFRTLPDLLKSLELHDKSLASYARRNQIELRYCKTLNDGAVHEALAELKPALVVFTGGGLIREKTLALAGHGVVNCHVGLLPEYRGMDVVEWPILYGNFDELGFTVHFMNRGVDTGDILGRFTVAPQAVTTVRRFRDQYEVLMSLEYVRCITRFLNGDIKRQPQQVADGKQYFTMHERLYDIAEHRLRAYVESTTESAAG
ncbi:MAG: hypothetical protein KDA60_08825 [Planctomycetales bacterium]|nr:hypothetical protein [Planctomycetales bacterium]